jgi:hypothetical protein
MQEFKLPRKVVERHVLRNTEENGNTADETFAFLRDRRNEGVTVERAWGEIEGLNGYQIQAYKLGLLVKDMEWHDWEGVTGEKTVNYLRNFFAPARAAAMDEARCLNGKQIQLLTLGLTRAQIEKHPSDDKTLRYTVDYLSDRLEGVTVEKAWEKIEGQSANTVFSFILARDEQRKKLAAGTPATFVTAPNYTNAVVEKQVGVGKGIGN